MAYTISKGLASSLYSLYTITLLISTYYGSLRKNRLQSFPKKNRLPSFKKTDCQALQKPDCQFFQKNRLPSLK